MAGFSSDNSDFSGLGFCWYPRFLGEEQRDGIEDLEKEKIEISNLEFHFRSKQKEDN